MAKTKQQKQTDLQSYVEKLSRSKGLVFANFDGLKVKEIEELRKKCREAGIDYLVTKKTLMKLALKEAGIDDVDLKSFDKGVASIFGYEDEVASAKIIGEFSATHEALKPVGGVLENKFIDQAGVISLSKLPGKNELLAKVVGSIQAPVSGFVRVLAGNLTGFVRVLDAIKESKS
ncbi:MAG: 50S ribosomal protein L10 [Candidatus Buchananbacteria bacterium]|nr:50S ribosomal protein L10 [Candidatus Buchananbacteria bacterium]